MVAKIDLPTEDIARRWINGETTRDLGIAFGVDPTTILRRLKSELEVSSIREISRKRVRSSKGRKATEIEKAWAAGFFDGEGSILIMNPSPKTGFRLRISCAQKIHRRPIDKLQSIWGGIIREDSRKIFTWKASGRQAMEFLQDILPYLNLTVKNEQAAIAIEFQSLR